MDSAAGVLAHPRKRAMRWNMLLSLALGVGIVVLGNLLAGRHLRVRTDLSADRLNAMSDATREIVGRMDDAVTVRLYATEEVQDGELALRTARVRSQLNEILQLRPAAFELQVLDPSSSSEANRNATDAGFAPMRSRAAAMEGGGTGAPVWLSLELSYRGRTSSIATPRPFEFETQFASALHGILADRKPGIGWVGVPVERPPLPTGTERTQAEIERARPSYRSLRTALERSGRFRSLEGLSTGRSVPDDIDVIFAVRPGDLSDRAVFELSRFVQRGGSLIVCVEDPAYNVLMGTMDPSLSDWPTSAMAKALKAWGCEVATTKQIWDGAWPSTRAGLVFPKGGAPAVIQVRSPMIVTVPADGFSNEVPATRGLAQSQFYWAHPIVPEELVPVPKGIVREDLVWSSEDARLDELVPRLPTEPASLRTRMTFLRQKPGTRRILGAAFRGEFPSVWSEGKVPPVLTADGSSASVQPAVEPLTEAGRGTGQVVVFGDADWLRDAWQLQGSTLVPFGSAGGLMLAQNLVDWLTLDEALIGLRSRA
ncbi:MAG: Gldg family protein, partial [Planctomycetota bacterium]